jgi:uncharacterized protein (TIGR02444 family)
VVDRYAKPGVAQACLELQERLGVDVSFLLTATFYATCRGLDLSAEEIANLDRCISAWRTEAIFPLRRLRRRLKSGDLLSLSTDEIYRRIKADELLAEQIEIGALVQRLEQMPAYPAAPSSRIVIERVIRHFAESSGQDANLVDDHTQRAISILNSSTT